MKIIDGRLGGILWRTTLTAPKKPAVMMLKSLRLQVSASPEGYNECHRVVIHTEWYQMTSLSQQKEALEAALAFCDEQATTALAKEGYDVDVPSEDGDNHLAQTYGLPARGKNET